MFYKRRKGNLNSNNDDDMGLVNHQTVYRNEIDIDDHTQDS